VFQDPTKGLPPLRGIHKQIHFIPIDSLQKSPTYRTNPKKFQEIQHQINHLLGCPRSIVFENIQIISIKQ